MKKTPIHKSKISFLGFSYTVKIYQVFLFKDIDEFLVIKLSVLKKGAFFAQKISYKKFAHKIRKV